MSYMVVGKIRDENLPDDFVVIIKPVDSVELAIHHIVSLTESFFDLKVVKVAMEFSSPAAAKPFESPVTATNISMDEICDWKAESDGYIHTTCGEIVQSILDIAGMKFCPYCSRKLHQC